MATEVARPVWPAGISGELWDSFSRRRISFAVLLIALVCHLVAFLLLARRDLGLRPVFHTEGLAAIVVAFAAGGLAVASRSVGAFRLIQVLRVLVLVATLRIIGPRTAVLPVLLLISPLIENAVYDDLAPAIRLDLLFVCSVGGSVGVLLAREAPEALFAFAAVFVVLTVAFAAMILLVVQYREAIVEYQQRIAALNATVVNLSDANRAFQLYADNLESESAEKERQRITRELHDTVGYALTNVIVMMNAGKVLLKQNPAALDDTFERVRSQTENALNETRQILHRLRQARRFEPEGIRAIAQLARSFEGATGVLVEMNTGNLPWSVGQRLDGVLFRFVQEGLTNAFRHGKASRVRVNLWQADAEIRVSVWDDGRGILAGKPIEEGIGFAGMRERLAALGGAVTARNAPDGFIVSATIPYRMGGIVE